jgi:hypothetical protein
MTRPWYARTAIQAAIVTGILGIIAAGVAGVFSRTARPDMTPGVPEASVGTDPAELRARQRQAENLRALNAAENDIDVTEMPLGTYAFLQGDAVYSRTGRVRRYSTGGFDFEIQRPSSGQRRLVGFTNADAAAAVARRDLQATFTLYSNAWANAPEMVTLPFDSIVVVRRPRLIQLNRFFSSRQALDLRWRR